MKKSKLWTVCLSLTLLSGQAIATIYKWVDANGQTHYDQVPPDNVNATQIKPQINHNVKPSTAENENNEAKKIIEELKKQDEKAAEDQQKALQTAKEEQVREINCKHAKEQLENLETNHRLKVPDASGNTTPLTEDQRIAQIKKTKEDVDKFCTPAKPASPQ